MIERFFFKPYPAEPSRETEKAKLNYCFGYPGISLLSDYIEITGNESMWIPPEYNCILIPFEGAVSNCAIDRSVSAIVTNEGLTKDSSKENVETTVVWLGCLTLRCGFEKGVRCTK
ncbi:hypothetical protein Tco_1377867 [Tanacetum coccineum]